MSSQSVRSIMIYGATGYVGALLVEQARSEGLDIIVAGRSGPAVNQLAEAASLPSRVGDVDSIDLTAVAVVVNAAGPFSLTSHKLAARCIETGTHYLDLAGEIAEYAEVKALNAAAQSSGVMLMPGVGFGVVPTDCLALHVSNRLPSATKLDIAFATTGGVSGGTLRSMSAGFGDRGAVPGPLLDTRKIEFADGTKRCIQNPWRGDLLTAPISTGIDDITTWIAVPKPIEMAIAGAHKRGSQDRPPLLARLVRRIAKRAPAGPSTSKLEKGHAEIWVQATDPAGNTAEATLSTPDAYLNSVDAALACAKAVIENGATPGFRTPAQEYGADFVLDQPGVTRLDR